MLVEGETNNNTVVEMENQCRTKKEMISTKSKKVLGFSKSKLDLLDIKLLQKVEKCVVKMVVSKYFNGELKLLKMKNKENVEISSKINNLNPYLDENGLIRVEESLEKSDINNHCKHAVQIPKVCGVIRKQDILVDV